MNKAEIKDKELLEKINSLYEDKMSVFVMANGRVRGALFHGTRFVNQLRAQHNLGILETMVLGQASLCAALVVPMMKDMEHTVIKYETDGPAQGFSVEADSKGTVRGFLYNEHIPVTKPLENWDLSSFLGKGTITFSRVHKDDKYPQSSTVPVDSGNIAKDFVLYFQQSEQIQTAFNTSIQFDKQGRVIGAGAMFLQIMPEVGGKKGSGANKSSQGNKEDDDILFERVELAFRNAPSLGQWFSEEGDADDIIYGLFREFNPSVALTRDIKFDCPCNEDGFIEYIKNLPKHELEDIKKNGPNPLEIVCRNCGSKYLIDVNKL